MARLQLDNKIDQEELFREVTKRNMKVSMIVRDREDGPMIIEYADETSVGDVNALKGIVNSLVGKPSRREQARIRKEELLSKANWSVAERDEVLRMLFERMVP